MFCNNPNVRGPNEQIEYTQEMIKEFIKCKEDIIYFAENYVKIATIDEGVRLIKCYDFQKKMLKSFHQPPNGKRHCIVLSSRQIGKCIGENTRIHIRNKETKAYSEMRIVDLYNEFGRNKVHIESNGKFIESRKVEKYEAFTAKGWKDITHIHKTKPFQAYEIKTKDFHLVCADDHLIVNSKEKLIKVKDLKKGSLIRTKIGVEKIKEIIKHNREENMYDLTIKSEDHTFYTNDILSHNSTISRIHLLHYILFNKDKVVAILANKERTAIDLMEKLKMGYENLPVWLQQGITEWNARSLKLENGVQVICASTSSDAIRGFTISLLYLDEFAFVPDSVALDFINSVYPTISSGKTSRIIIVSTPNGMNHFYNIWQSAIKNENSYFPVKVNWWEVPGRDEKFKEETIKNLPNGIISWNQEFGNKFLGSTATVIDSDILEKLVVQKPRLAKYDGNFLIYEEPKKDCLYFIGVDSAKGTAKDYSCVQVLKVESNNWIRQVAVYRDNKIGTYDFAQICISISKYYNNAYMMIENNGVGGEVLQSIWHDFEYENICNIDPKGLGICATKQSKLEAVIMFKEYIEKGMIEIVDKQTVYELSSFVEVSSDVFRSETDLVHDDTIFALLWALYTLKTDYYDSRDVSLQKIDNKYKLEKNEEPEEEFHPMMFFNDGRSQIPEMNENFADFLK